MRKQAFTFSLLLLFSYVAVRAINVNFTYDEIWTCSGFVSQSYCDIIRLHPCDANNHILNTILIKVLFYICRPGPFIARIPNLIAFSLYLSTVYRLVKQDGAKGTSFFAAILLCFNPFCLDFFSLARGYGLALSFELLSIYLLLEYHRSNRVSILFAAVISSGLAVFSNFSFLTFTCSFSVVIIIMAIRQSIKIKWLAPTVSFYIGLFIYSYLMLHKLQLANKLYYGGNTGIYIDSLRSFLDFSTGRHLSAQSIPIVQLIITIAFLLVSTGAFVRMYLDKRVQWKPVTISLIFILCIAFIYLQHALLKTKLPIDRGVIFLYPLFCVSFVLNFNVLLHDRRSLLRYFLYTALSIPVCANFILNANIYKTIAWDFESRTVDMLNLINAKGKSNNIVYRVDSSWPLLLQADYHKDYLSYDYLSPVSKESRSDLCDSCDYYLFINASNPKVGYDADEENVKKIYRKTVLSYPKEHIYLLSK